RSDAVWGTDVEALLRREGCWKFVALRIQATERELRFWKVRPCRGRLAGRSPSRGIGTLYSMQGEATQFGVQTWRHSYVASGVGNVLLFGVRLRSEISASGKFAAVWAA